MPENHRRVLIVKMTISAGIFAHIVYALLTRTGTIDVIDGRLFKRRQPFAGAPKNVACFFVLLEKKMILAKLKRVQHRIRAVLLSHAVPKPGPLNLFL